MDQLNITSQQLNSYAAIRNVSIDHIAYQLSPELNAAIEVAIALNQPLMITGEPGTGKTKLAAKIAEDLHFISAGAYRKEPYEFHAKSNSVYTDLLYTYDAMGHFYAANIRKVPEPELKQFIELNPLGQAIVASMSEDQKKEVPARNIPDPEIPASSVVLIDEIDKAPRDFPNDLLKELDRYSFRIKEAGMADYTKAPAAHILVILTSNGEKDFPDAFLRRCIFHRINFPDREMLVKILDKHAILHQLGEHTEEVLNRFDDLRKLCRNKKPATAELLAWCRIISQKQIDPRDVSTLAPTLPVVIKDIEDLETVRKQWFNGTGNEW